MFKESFLFAVNSVSVNKLRTFLSLFGITIGIVSIISVFTVFDWMENGIKTSIESLGDNTIYVAKWPWTPDPDIKWWDMMRWPAPSIDDYEAILKNHLQLRRFVSLWVQERRLNTAATPSLTDMLWLRHMILRR